MHCLLCVFPHRKNSDDVALLPAREASARCPQVVIDFYEQKLTWHCGDEEQWSVLVCLCALPRWTDKQLRSHLKLSLPSIECPLPSVDIRGTLCEITSCCTLGVSDCGRCKNLSGDGFLSAFSPAVLHKVIVSLRRLCWGLKLTFNVEQLI